MEEIELTLPDYEDTGKPVSCFRCTEPMEPKTVTINVTYKDREFKIHNCRVYRCTCCRDTEVYSAKTAYMIEQAVHNAVEDI